MLSWGSDECKLNVWVKVAAAVAERQLELLNTVHLLDSKRNDDRLCSLVEKLAHALDHWVIKEAEKQNLNLVWNRLFLQDNSVLLVRDMLLLRLGWSQIFNLHINERNDARLQLILWCFDDNYKLLSRVCLQLDAELLLQLFRCRVFNVPAVKLCFRILDCWPVFVLKWQFFSVVLTENIIARIILSLWNWHLDILFLSA